MVGVGEHPGDMGGAEVEGLGEGLHGHLFVDMGLKIGKDIVGHCTGGPELREDQLQNRED